MIGIFDSGLGGLTVAKEVLRQLPQYQLLYLGDTARTPYGNRSPALIYSFTEQAVEFLFQQDCQLIIVACNTASAQALRQIQQQWLPRHFPDRRVLGVIRPAAEAAVKQSRNAKIGVIGTRATIGSQAYVRELKAQLSSVQVFQQACPLLVPLIEEGWLKRPETKKIIRYYLKPLKQQSIDTLVLGCTHYPFLHKEIKQAVGKRIQVVDSAQIVAAKLKDYLDRHPEIESKLKKNDRHRFLVTDKTDHFQKLAQDWLTRQIEIEKITFI